MQMYFFKILIKYKSIKSVILLLNGVPKEIGDVSIYWSSIWELTHGMVLMKMGKASWIIFIRNSHYRRNFLTEFY